MLFRDNDEPLLTTWLERRLAKVSDAEAPILAEYCIALLRHDQPEEKVFNLCVDSLGDFLKGDTKSFVTDVFKAIKNRSFARSSSTVRPLQAVQPAITIAASKPLHKVQDVPPIISNSPVKAITKDTTSAQFPEMPLPPPEMLMDPAFMIHMQQFARPQLKRKRCFAFDQRGFCRKGAACPYEHITEQTETRNFHEYDPKFSSMNGAMKYPVIPVVPPTNANAVQTSTTADGCGNCALSIENIPKANLNEPSVRTFFSRFGQVLSVEIDHSSNRAIVNFADQSVANAAFNSPAAVFDNRFIKILRLPSTTKSSKHGSNSKAPATTTPQSQQPSLDLASLASKQAEHEARLKKKLELESKSAALAQELALLAKEKEEHARMLMDLDPSHHDNNAGDDDIYAVDPGANSDTTSTLQAQLAELKGRAAILGVTPPAAPSLSSHRGRGRRRGRGAAARGGRGGAPYSNGPRSLDLRPRTLRIESSSSDYSLSDVEAQVRQDGQYESIQVHDGNVLVTFKTRRDAEVFSVARRALGKMSWMKSDQLVGETESQHQRHMPDRVMDHDAEDDEDADRYDD